MIKKGATGENKTTRDFSFSIIENFHGYKLIIKDLKSKEKEDFQTIDIVYEPVGNENELVICCFTDNIHLAYRNFVNKKEKGEDKISNLTVKQCHYCENFFVKTKDAMEKYKKVCAVKEGIVYTFENGKIISFQDNFKYLGDVSFTVYFDFKTTTGHVVFLGPKMFVVSLSDLFVPP